MTNLRILLADNHEFVRLGLKFLIHTQPDGEVVGETDNGPDALALAARLAPDVLVLDYSMPRLDGVQTARRLREIQPRIKILMLTRHKELSYMHRALLAGVDGYLLKQSAAPELLTALRAVAAGRGYLDPALTPQMLAEYPYPSRLGRAAPDGAVSAREAEVLRLVALGYGNKEMAGLLDVSVKTVDMNKARAMRRLGLRNRVEVVRYALAHGWLNPA